MAGDGVGKRVGLSPDEELKRRIAWAEEVDHLREERRFVGPPSHAAGPTQLQEIEFAINNQEPEVRVPFKPWPDVEHMVGEEANDWNAWIVMGRDRTGNYTDTSPSEKKYPEVGSFNLEDELIKEGISQAAAQLGVDSPFGGPDANMRANLEHDGPPSGWGPARATHAGSIDLVVGRLSADPSGKLLRLNSNDQFHPHFGTDAARIYISQKSNVDYAFHLAEGSAAPESRSTVAMKADTIRLIGREGIKLVTSTDAYNSLAYHGDGAGKISSVIGIDLIAGNVDANLQPLVKGKALIQCLREILEEVGSLSGQVVDLASQVGVLAADYGTHIHIAQGPVGPSTNWPPAPLVAEWITERAANVAQQIAVIGDNLYRGIEQTFLGQPGLEGSAGPEDPIHHREYICSRWNNTN